MRGISLLLLSLLSLPSAAAEIELFAWERPPLVQQTLDAGHLALLRQHPDSHDVGADLDGYPPDHTHVARAVLMHHHGCSCCAVQQMHPVVQHHAPMDGHCVAVRYAVHRHGCRDCRWRCPRR